MRNGRKRKRRLGELLHSPVPFGLGATKPHHYREMVRILWENRSNLRYAWRVLTRGVCDGCALGTSGLRDWTIEGTHLCLVRLNLLRLNTMDAFDPGRLADVSALAGASSRELRELGRLGWPLRRRRGEPGFRRVTWEEAWEEIGPRWRAAAPERCAMFVTSRGVTNEVYYVAQKVLRYLGSNSVDNSARLCHSPSTSGLKTTLGVAATTCSYRDWYDADLIVFFGSNPANDQPVAMKYLETARRRGARVLLVNAYREPGMQVYWIPSSPASALFGTRMCDDTFLVRVGGDLAFLNAVQKVAIERGSYRREFVESATTGFEELQAELERQPLEALCAAAGTTRERVEAFVDELERAGPDGRAVFVWSMGITQHERGADTVRAIVNLGLLFEHVGRPGTGMMPIRGHSGVQGGAEMGAYATAFPGGVPIDAQSAERFSELWGFDVPASPGLTTVDALAAAGRGELDAFYVSGGNFLETLPRPDEVRSALERIPLRVHVDIVPSSQMLVDPAEVVYVLPARTRYEQEGGGTETSTERRVIFSPEIPGHRVGEARTEWRILLDLARSVRPDGYERVDFGDCAAIRAEIERAVPFYAGIAALAKQGDQFQWGGERLCADRTFPTPDGKAHFRPVAPELSEPDPSGPDEGTFLLATRRGKQFNSMIQSERDQLTGAERDHVFVSSPDAARLGLATGDPLVLESPHGRLPGRAFLADVAPGTLQAHWPEANVLIPSGRTDPDGGVPDYNVRVRVIPAKATARQPGAS